MDEKMTKVGRFMKKAGIFVLGMMTDQLQSHANKMRHIEKTQYREGYNNMSDDELKKLGRTCNDETKKSAIIKELSERKDDNTYEKISILTSYGVEEESCRQGNFVSEDQSVFIKIGKYTNAEMQFCIFDKSKKFVIQCEGKMLGRNKAFYSGQGCTISMTWEWDDEFVVSGKVPWQETDIKLLMTRYS